jgi:inositol-phosphate phosphatase/L-galactose 1-phosphate phosphatase/histidinol-phosphatase
MDAFTTPVTLLEFAERLADAARPVSMKYFRRPLDVELKADASPVTLADREVEEKLRRLIEARFPDHGIVGEEHGSSRAEAEYVWVIDPIDGTKSFITGRPLFGTLIALVRQGRPVVGVIDQPALGERWTGALGHPTRMNGAPVRTRPCDRLAEVTIMTSSPHYYVGDDFERLERLRLGSRFILYGTECLAYGLLASGHVDVVIEAGMDPFDYLAAVPVVEGAGGRISDWQGRPLGLGSGDKVLAAGDAAIHEAALECLMR